MIREYNKSDTNGVIRLLHLCNELSEVEEKEKKKELEYNLNVLVFEYV